MAHGDTAPELHRVVARQVAVAERDAQVLRFDEAAAIDALEVERQLVVLARCALDEGHTVAAQDQPVLAVDQPLVARSPVVAAAAEQAPTARLDIVHGDQRPGSHRPVIPRSNAPVNS
jgi:hypothetical protein